MGVDNIIETLSPDRFQRATNEERSKLNSFVSLEIKRETFPSKTCELSQVRKRIANR